MKNDITNSQTKSQQQAQFSFMETVPVVSKTAAEDDFIDDPLVLKTEELATKIADVLDEERSVAEVVFQKLRSKRGESLRRMKLELDAEEQNASRLAFCRAVNPAATEEEKEKARQEVRADIDRLYHEILKNKRHAGKLMRNACLYAKEIGDRLTFVKSHLLEHGEYEDWVEKNFQGGLSTARAYTRLAKLKNWQKVSEKIYANMITLEEALALIRECGPEKEPEDPRTRKALKGLHSRFKEVIRRLPENELIKLSHSFCFIDDIQTAAECRGLGKDPMRAFQRDLVLNILKDWPDGVRDYLFDVTWINIMTEYEDLIPLAFEALRAKMKAEWNAARTKESVIRNRQRIRTLAEAQSPY